MPGKRALAAVCLAAGLLVSPLQPSGSIAEFGVPAALAEKCRLEVEVCQEIDLIVYKTRACWKLYLFCG